LTINLLNQKLSWGFILKSTMVLKGFAKATIFVNRWPLIINLLNDQFLFLFWKFMPLIAIGLSKFWEILYFFFIWHSINSKKVTSKRVTKCLACGYQPFPWLALLLLTIFNSFLRVQVPPFGRDFKAWKFWRFLFQPFQFNLIIITF